MSIIAALVATVLVASPLDDYLNKEDGFFSWFDTGVRLQTPRGGTAYVLNVTSQQWLNSSMVVTPAGNGIWQHTAVVVVPKVHTVKDKATLYIAGKCNVNFEVEADDVSYLFADEVAESTNAIGVVLYQVPNCPLVFPSDPVQQVRIEDAILAFGWRKYADTQDPHWLLRLPMVKAAFKVMQAVEEYTVETKIADIDGWFVSGPSKRGMTTWSSGYVECTYPKCPRIVGIAPLVPIVPDVYRGLHQAIQAHNGWMFALADYYVLGLPEFLDSPRFQEILQIIDPINHIEKLRKLPKHVVIASNDEFMMFEWTNLWWNKMKGEKHLTIVPNARHIPIVGYPEANLAVCSTINSVFRKQRRPAIYSNINRSTGTIAMKVPFWCSRPVEVNLWQASTVSTTNRDFRWIRIANNATGACNPPETSIPAPFPGGPNCLVPIVWTKTALDSTRRHGTLFKASVPLPTDGTWTGFYIEARFRSSYNSNGSFALTTPGLVWPDTLPYPDCQGPACQLLPLV